MASSMHIAWSDWNAESFARAAAEGKPVLLSLHATWCRSSREMDRTSYADPAVAQLVNDSFVAVRVDADRRPDIAERYSLGGLPTTAFLTSAGALFGGGTHVPVERMASALRGAAEAVRSRQDEIAHRAGDSALRRPAVPGGSAPRAPDELIQTVFETYDATHGGFGAAPKFPLIAPLELALSASASQRAMTHIAATTLDAMAAGLYDEVDGGFFRCAATRDWRQPQTEKLLDVNAALLRLFLDAADALDVARYREVAAGAVRYLQACLADVEHGGWAGSQEADETYYAARTREARAGVRAPALDRTLFCGANAVMISAALRAAEALDSAALGEFAIRSLERLLPACYAPGAGVAHYLDDGPCVRGLLDDQIAMAHAALDAAEATGRVPYEMIAEELALHVVRTMWDERDGGVFDRAPDAGGEDVGLLRMRLKPFASNCDAARLFGRLAAASGDQEFADRARATLESLAPVAASQGPLAAHYVIALRQAGVR
jgi:uncharacterized protein YyaL (SSP411 family)